jgi:hypothetical protein
MNVILTKEEEQKRDDLIRLIIHAAEVVEFHIKRLKCHTEYKDTLDDLNMGLNNLYAGIKNFREDSEFFLKLLKRDKHKRGGFGLSRGFGEFLRALPKEDEYWASEIMDAVHAIEDYYRSM